MLQDSRAGKELSLGIAELQALPEVEGSIHQVGAAMQNASACNGWEYWYFKDKNSGNMVCIDELRQQIRSKVYGDL